ncbi:hypothetical protein ACNFU2_02595 [Chryseobacterium sp. PTM-20240506]|uniref:hypothetical protein n=1 Tax=unclassified Chryseobacterium TaxID=2593645 RepID=UPI001554CF2E|nr:MULTISPECIES: hypothetical protein [unclassified Chryseobacterium]MDC8103747.1 hypothetical protein [Chryseobacterium sp. B21-037]MDQ1803355.1 hypothetical protein [Chryseobacterium sp. CKR4-1]WBV57280.1 hypothetical protein PFY10_02335 [Chryseobacterium daecheongense]
MKNLKSLERSELRRINGGYLQCPANLECGDDWCCINGACRPRSQAGPNGLCMAIIID